MEYSPPPLFKQGASARAKVVFFSLIAIALLVVDSRMQSLSMVRRVVATALYPVQMVALMPRNAMLGVAGYFSSLSSIEQENKRLREQTAANAQTLQRAQQLFSENAHLRQLLGTAEQLPVKSVMSEILYDARDVFTRKIVLDRGSQHGVAAGQPVIDDTGVVGQVTRVFPFTSEATLLTDKDQAIPVQVVRSGLRSVAYGRGQSGVLDLRFIATNADIQKGDKLVTSGIDGVYPSGLSVATVVQVESKSSDAFARIVCQPSAGIDRNKQLLILLAQPKVAPRLAPEEPREKKDKKGSRTRPGATAKEPGKDQSKNAVKPAATDRSEKPVVPAGPPKIAVPKPRLPKASARPAAPSEATQPGASKEPAAAVLPAQIKGPAQ